MHDNTHDIAYLKNFPDREKAIQRRLYDQVLKIKKRFPKI